MFSSNQIFQVSGDMLHLESALQFALEYSDNLRCLNKEERDRGCKLVYQITDKGKYCIGWGFKEVPGGWQEFDFDIDVKSLSNIIAMHLSKLNVVDNGYGEGYESNGFLMKSIMEIFGDYGDIKNAFYGIVSFEPYLNFYAK